MEWGRGVGGDQGGGTIATSMKENDTILHFHHKAYPT